MLKALLLLLMHFALAGTATAQNLVLNGSFEDTISCDLPVIGIRKATHWYTANSATPDVWDADLDRECGFPLDPNGFPGWWYITPYDGLRHAGAYYWDGPGSSNTREFMMTRLSTPLASGMAYEVSLRYALSGTYEFAVDHIGVWLGMDSLYEAQSGWLHVTPQLKLRDPQHIYLTETEAWTMLKDTLVAAGGEEWIVIGNFDVADSVNGISAYPDAINEYAYYYIDAVSVREVDQISAIEESDLTANWMMGGLSVRWRAGCHVDKLTLMDARGRLISVDHTEQSGDERFLQLPPLAPGLYLVQATGGGKRSSIRIIKSEGGY